jgi:bifunctional non-homologous end joining protein LigD
LSADGLKAFQIASKRGLEGVVCKSLASIYLEKRSKEWLKVKVHQEDEFVIGGFTQPTGSRQYFGALLLGVYSRNKLLYVGKVGTGFDTEMLGALHRKFQPLIRSKCPFASVVRERDATFLSPKLVAQLTFTEWTKDGKLRHPVYLGLRDDKKPNKTLNGGRFIHLDGPSGRTRHFNLEEILPAGADHARISGINAPEFPEPTPVRYNVHISPPV